MYNPKTNKIIELRSIEVSKIKSLQLQSQSKLPTTNSALKITNINTNFSGEPSNIDRSINTTQIILSSQNEGTNTNIPIPDHSPMNSPTSITNLDAKTPVITLNPSMNSTDDSQFKFN